MKTATQINPASSGKKNTLTSGLEMSSEGKHRLRTKFVRSPNGGDVFHRFWNPPSNRKIRFGEMLVPATKNKKCCTDLVLCVSHTHNSTQPRAKSFFPSFHYFRE